MLKKPEWLKVEYSSKTVDNLNDMFKDLHLNTVCNEANCPNKGECYRKRTATFMILGSNCTRHCKFCNVSKNPVCKVDENEPENVAVAISKMGLKHAVITSVTRDDLPDGGAAHFAKVTTAIREKNPDTIIELLIPDLKGDTEALKTVLEAKPDILGHNLETVPRLYSTVRPEANYKRSLEVLINSKKIDKNIVTKTGIMVGLGETEEEVIALMHDVFETGCEIMTIGQYLRPSKEHIEIVEYVHPDVFAKYAEEGKKIGIKYVYSAPLVRSSYHAAEAFEKAKDSQ